MILGYLLLLFPLMLLISCAVYIPYNLYRRRKYGRRPFIRHLGIVLLLVTIISLASITLFLYGGMSPSQTGFHALNLKPFNWLSSIPITGLRNAIMQYVLNIMMFIPLGFFLPVVFYGELNFFKTAGISFLVTFGIETIQYFIGRSSDIDDIIANLIGGILGYLIFKLCSMLFSSFSFWKKLCGQEY